MLNILVGTNTCGFESFGTQLFQLVGDKVNTCREFIDTSALAAKIEDTDLRIGYTTVEAGFWVWL